VRGAFAIIACVALGLAIGAAPPPVDDFNWGYVPHFNWQYALLAAGSAGLVIGVVRDAWSISNSRSEIVASSQFNFALRWAVAWRLVVAVVIAACLSIKIILARKFWSLPESDLYFYDDVVTGYVWWLGLLIALGSAINRPSDVKPRPRGAWLDIVAMCLAAALLLSIVIDLAMIHYLVHVACAGVDAALHHSESRYGLRDVADETRFFTLGALAVGALIGGCALISYLVTKAVQSNWLKRAATLTALLLLGYAVAYVVWFYRMGMPMAAPELAVAGLCSSWFLRLGGITLAIMAVSVGAYRLTLVGDLPRSAPIFISGNKSEAFAVAPVFILLAAISYLAESLHYHNSFGGGFGFINGLGAGSIWESIGALTYQPTTYFMLALLTFSLRCLWRRWRRGPANIQIEELDPRRFARCWLTIAALTILTVPTIGAFGFAFWLGPWYRW
jgi:hypothetical protein